MQGSPSRLPGGHTHSLLAAAPRSLALYTYVRCMVSVNTWLQTSQSSVASVPGQAVLSILESCSRVSCLPLLGH